MEEAKKAIYQKAVKRFTKDNITNHKKYGYKSLTENLTRFPNKGVDFKVWQKHNSTSYFYLIKKL